MLFRRDRLRFVVGAWLPLTCCACTESAPAPRDRATPRPLVVEVRALWMEGADEDRADMDRYFECLIYGSNLQSYWEGEVVLQYTGSQVVAPPSSRLRIEDGNAYLAPLRADGELKPVGDPSATTVDIIFGPATHLQLDGCAQLTRIELNERTAGLAMVRVSPSCWPGTTSLRNETQLALHELVEVVDSMLGYASCAAGGACQADGACPLRCDAFVGLMCEGAPTQTATGCGLQVLDGWIVQRLSHEGRDPKNCLRCTTCNFVPASLPP